MTDSTSAVDRIDSIREEIDAALPAVVEGRQPDLMYDPIRYVLESGGKRVRPTLLALIAGAYGADLDDAMPAALAVEVFHNFTLVHDDIMDGAAERRGRPAVHAKWSEGTAILTGDLMLSLSYELLTQLEDVDLRAVFDVYNAMVERLCVGQRLDTDFETRLDVTVSDYVDMIDGKTGALLACGFELGALVGEADAPDRNALAEAGRLVGRAFQVQDDLLDLVADDDDWGKDVGGDLKNGKRTLLTLGALERSTGEEHDWFARLLDGGLPAADVPEARERMDRLGVLDDARAAVSRYTADALDRLDVLPDSPSADAVRWMLRRLEARSH